MILKYGKTHPSICEVRACIHFQAVPSNAPQDSQTHLLRDHLQYSFKLAKHPLVDQQPHGGVQDVAICYHAKERTYTR